MDSLSIRRKDTEFEVVVDNDDEQTYNVKTAQALMNFVREKIGLPHYGRPKGAKNKQRVGGDVGESH